MLASACRERTSRSPVPISSPTGSRARSGSRSPCTGRRRKHELELNLLDAGSLTYLLGGRRVTLRPRRLSAFWAATPHQILASQDVTFYYVLTVRSRGSSAGGCRSRWWNGC